ncbi:hypothetical protein MUG94_10300 [Arthrobacter gengyunqii]|uniref:Uncharacterized protein n=1 Tax=Arthrobacter gengyunqii TaxID=2886940 RepID=A0A9X1M1D9_9MICC|nr:hypothetical protein [Arthrobacter gengyunqii]MCC3269055.1 hypothetical protein [Arthrobacter gengyunqii]UOY94974.1 hypothetical protein MUG94_10300 [Arthrobacter gengyunqii]
MKNLPLSLTLAAVSGVLTLKSPAGWSPGVRRSYVLAPGAAIGIIAGAAVWKGSQKGREKASAGRIDLVTPAASRSTDGAAGTAPLPSYVRADARPARLPAIGLAVLAATVGITVSGVLAVSLVLDERLETWLLRRGVARPRRVMAVIAAMSSLVLDQMMDLKGPEDARK